MGAGVLAVDLLRAAPEPFLIVDQAAGVLYLTGVVLVTVQQAAETGFAVFVSCARIEQLDVLWG